MARTPGQVRHEIAEALTRLLQPTCVRRGFYRRQIEAMEGELDRLTTADAINARRAAMGLAANYANSHVG